MTAPSDDATLARRTKWLLGPVRNDGDFRLFGFPYSGAGASSFRRWPSQIGSGLFQAVQPPGKENRIAEKPYLSLDAFAGALVDAIAFTLDRPFAFIGHCGAVPGMIQTALCLADRGMPVPSRIFASAWGAPHRGLHGRLSYVDFTTTDLREEIVDLNRILGQQMPEALFDVAVEAMRDDLVLQRSMIYSGTPRIPCPVSVIAWTGDVVVPPDQVFPAWEECASVDLHLLVGDHGEFLRLPSVLIAVIGNSM